MKIEMTPGVFKYKTAYHPVIGDPLLAASVVIVPAPWGPRFDHETDDTGEIRKDLRARGISFIPEAKGDGQQIVYLNR